MNTNDLIVLEKVGLDYGPKTARVSALRDVQLSVPRGQYLAIVGRSGSGKSSLLNLITGIDHPSTGRVVVGGAEVHGLSENQLALWRGKNVGIVFQFFQLIPTLTVAENLMLPMEFVGKVPARERQALAKKLLEQVGLADHAHKLPGQLSGGEQQRTALARALANDPPLIVADEPTGNLDSANAAVVGTLLKALAAQGKTVVVVTHEREPAGFDRIVTLSDGAVVSDVRRTE